MSEFNKKFRIFCLVQAFCMLMYGVINSLHLVTFNISYIMSALLLIAAIISAAIFLAHSYNNYVKRIWAMAFVVIMLIVYNTNLYLIQG